MHKRLLIISHDVVGRRMAGPGIRYWELARALASHLDVTLIAPAPIDLEPGGLRLGSYAWGDAGSLASWLAEADMVLANAYTLAAHPELAVCPAPLLLDLYDPTLLENLEHFRERPDAERAERARSDVELLRRQLAAGDAFLCATERQRDLYIGALMHAGRITPAQVDADPLLRELIAVVPFGLPTELPERSGSALRAVLPGIGPDDLLILWTGGLWDWMDPQTLVRAMPTVVAAAPTTRLVFLAGRHPGNVPEMRAPAEARAIAQELGLLDRHIFFYSEWVPYARRADFLLEADLAVSLHRPSLETTYAAVRSRFLDHLWAGLPSLVGDGDSAAELVRRHDLGRVVPAGNVAATAAALIELIGDPELRAMQAAHARALGRQYAWERVAAPIHEFIWSVRPMRDHEPITPPAPPDTASSIEARNRAIMRLDDLWQVKPQPLSSIVPLVGQIKETANSLTRWYLQTIIEQQNQFNAAVVRALQHLSSSADTERGTLQDRAQSVEEQLRQLMMLQQRVSLQIAGVIEHLTSLQKQVDQIEQRFDPIGQEFAQVWLEFAQIRREVAPLHQHVADIEVHLCDIDDAQTALAQRMVSSSDPAGEKLP